MLTLTELNQCTSDEFSKALGGVYEHSPWIAARAYALKPANGFATLAQMYATLVAVVHDSNESEKIALLNAHPELAGKEAASGVLTEASTAEQASAGLTKMTAADVAQLRELNTLYREKFGFPFIIAVRNNTQSAIFGAIKSRMANTQTMEINNALMQVGEIARHRLINIVSE